MYEYRAASILMRETDETNPDNECMSAGWEMPRRENRRNELSCNLGCTSPHENGVGLSYPGWGPALGVRPSLCLVP
jgi:hypothetical protein